MNRLLLLLLLLAMLIAVNVSAQTHIETFPTSGTSFTVKCEPTNDNGIRVIIKDGMDDKELVSYKIYTSDMEVFATIFVQHFTDSCKLQDTVKTAQKKIEWTEYGRELLKRYLTSLQNTLPKAGNFKLSEFVKMGIKCVDGNGQVRSYVTASAQYKVERLRAEITDGYLENIVVDITNGKKTLRFSTPYPMGMSSVGNFKSYSYQKLYPMNTYPFQRPLVDKPIYTIKLGDLIDYDYVLGIQRRDYSPKDTVLDMQGGTSVLLHKEETQRLFEAHIYSDFQGFNEKKPNGLLQFELAKRININTVQHLSFRGFYWVFSSFGFMQYIMPSVTLSKVEQHNRRLNLLDLDSVRLNPGNTDATQFKDQFHRYANALSLYQYQWLSVGTDLNLFYLNNQDRKFNVCFNAGIRFGFTDAVDSLTTVTSTSITKTKFIKEISITTMQLYPEIKIKFMPEERFNFSISNKWVYYKPLNPVFQMASFDRNDQTKLISKSKAWINMSEMLMAIQVNQKSKVFGRFRMNWEMGNIKNNFSQLQVGYSTYILGNK